MWTWEPRIHVAAAVAVAAVAAVAAVVLLP